MPSRKSSQRTRSHRSTLSLQKTEIVINVYDLLPPGRLSSALWLLGTSLLHSGVVINDKEYAYGGHDRPGVTGVYWTKPKTQPPGGTFKCEILHGFSLASPTEIDTIIKEVSEEFQGTTYNLLTKNCNHFTAYLCQRLTGRPGPGWLNRAASIGVAFPCVVPREWVEPPDFDTADGELLGEEDESTDERSRMLRSSSEGPRLVGHEQSESTDGETDGDSEDEGHRGASGKGKARAPVRDSGGRNLPASERAPAGR
ncbi:DUF862-domain-containing protein [Coniochaeta ligniaria NRRL 30616]|uniref:DUF862-domain-containing protein n=1 Tax=Coniochaeta ligniaria NRRL 30616 TaxID=1408157 RepID=A0A1J7JZ35_9PEZI|nr:DUF862-domain-containing protein [Coniochaeta ligniaria NRRL 30616]